MPRPPTNYPYRPVVVGTGLSDHEAAADPHPMYLTSTEAGSLYAAAGHTHAIANVTGLQGALDAKQAALVSGTNIKTLNGNSLLGSGDLVVGGSSDAIRVVESGETKANDTSVQNWFASNSGVALDANSTYEFEGELRITKSNQVSASISVRFADISGASIEYSGLGCQAVINTGATAVRYFTDTRFNTSVQATASATTAGALVRVQGVVRTTTAGTFTPQFAFSAAPGSGTNSVRAGTRMRVRKLGDNTFTNQGWA